MAPVEFAGCDDAPNARQLFLLSPAQDCHPADLKASIEQVYSDLTKGGRGLAFSRPLDPSVDIHGNVLEAAADTSGAIDNALETPGRERLERVGPVSQEQDCQREQHLTNDETLEQSRGIFYPTTFFGLPFSWTSPGTNAGSHRFPAALCHERMCAAAAHGRLKVHLYMNALATPFCTIVPETRMDSLVLSILSWMDASKATYFGSILAKFVRWDRNNEPFDELRLRRPSNCPYLRDDELERSFWKSRRLALEGDDDDGFDDVQKRSKMAFHAAFEDAHRVFFDGYLEEQAVRAAYQYVELYRHWEQIDPSARARVATELDIAPEKLQHICLGAKWLSCLESHFGVGIFTLVSLDSILSIYEIHSQPASLIASTLALRIPSLRALSIRISNLLQRLIDESMQTDFLFAPDKEYKSWDSVIEVLEQQLQARSSHME